MSAWMGASAKPQVVGTAPNDLPWIVANRAQTLAADRCDRDPAAPGRGRRQLPRSLPPTADACRAGNPGIAATVAAGVAGSWLRRTSRPVGAGADGARGRHPTGRGSGSRARWRARAAERTHSRLNVFGRLRRCPERKANVVDLDLFLAASIVVIQQLLRAIFHNYRWSTRSTTRRLR